MKKTVVVTDLGPGDGGKGGVVQKVGLMTGAHTIIKRGGFNGSHGVKTARGEEFAFSQLGCGTFDGVKTFISSQMVISPEGLLNEASILRYKFGIHDVFELLTIDPRALVATPYHGIASRLKELSLGKNHRGTVGTGAGDTYRSLEKFSEQAIRASDLSRTDILDRLALVREQKKKELAVIIQGEFLLEDQNEAEREIELLYDDDFLKYAVGKFQEVSKLISVVDPDYLRREILSKDGTIIVENSHGVLTDNCYGFHPHTSAFRTLPNFSKEMLLDAGYDGQILTLGVSRAYQVRHGAGPMPTADIGMLENLLPGSQKGENRYQGKIRVGPLDFVLLRYAIEVCGGPSAFDGLAITWFDQIQKNGKWRLCNRYEDVSNQDFFNVSGGIKVYQGPSLNQLEYQKNLGQHLFKCRPEIDILDLPVSANRNDLYSFCVETIKEKTGVPVRMVSFGPTECDKVCR